MHNNHRQQPVISPSSIRPGTMPAATKICAAPRKSALDYPSRQPALPEAYTLLRKSPGIKFRDFIGLPY